MGMIAARIKDKIEKALSPQEFKLVDDSAKHAGHMGARPEGETHFTLSVISAAFTGKSRLERQRLVYALLADEMRERVHALSLNLKAPEDA